MRRLSFLVLAGSLAAVNAQEPPPAPSPSAATVPDMLVSRQLLEREHLSIGQVVELSRDAAGSSARRFRIAGSYEPVPDPMRFAQQRLEARVHLPDLQALEPDRAGAVGRRSHRHQRDARGSGVRSGVCGRGRAPAAGADRARDRRHRRAHVHLCRARTVPSGHRDRDGRRQRRVSPCADGDARRRAPRNGCHAAAHRSHARAAC